MIKISVIVPVYNVEKYLRECLDSIIDQTLKDIEIICVNDGSTDNSLQILEEYAKKDNRILVISKQNTGYGNTMNIGIDKARGKYINFVESDDFVDSNMLEELYDLAEEKGLEVVKTDSRCFVDVEGVHVFTARNVLGKEDEDLYGKILSSRETLDSFKGYVYTWAGIYRRDFIEKYHIRHNESPGASYQDNGFWFQTNMYAERLLFHNKAYYNLRRDNPNSSIHSKEKVFCICDEYDFIDHKIAEAALPDKHRLFEVGMLWRIKNYIGMYDRIGEQYRQDYWKRIKEDIQKAFGNGCINPTLYSELEWKYIYYICRNDNPTHIDKIAISSVAVRKINSCENAYIYGAGKVAQNIYNRLSNADLLDKLKGVIVTKRDTETFCGMKVEQIEQVNLTKDDLVVISVGNKIQSEIKQIMNDKSHLNYICADEMWT